MNVPLKQYWVVLANYLRAQRGKVLLLTVLLFSSIGLQLISPQIVRAFIDAAQAGSTLETLTRLALFFLGVALLKYLVTLAATYVSEDVGWTATNALRADLAIHCLRLDMGFHNTHTPGELIERVDGDVGKLARFFSQLIIQALGNVLLLVGVLIVLFFEDWRVGLAFTVFAAIALTILHSMRDIATPYLKARSRASADLFGFLEERLGGTEDIRANGGNAYTMRRLFGNMRTLWQTDSKAYRKIVTLRTTTIAWFAVGGILSLVLGVYLFGVGAISIGTVYLIYAYVQMLARPVEQLALELQSLQEASASILRVEELYQTQSAIHDGDGASLPLGALAVEYENVSFGYDRHQAANDGQETTNDGRRATEDGNGTSPQPSGSKMVLHDLSFRLEAGKTLGLLGRTGSGKSTITRLILRLYDPQKGVIRLGDVDIRKTRLADLREQIGMVTQDVQLFNATMRDNLTFFDRSIPDVKILRVIEELGLADWYRSLPDGLDTELDFGGGGLSAGEAQLLAFTRVFLKDPALVILDEASSRLDPITERLIERAIDRLLRNRTGIIIAHRLETVQRVDEIMILQGGRICEYGLRVQLADDPTSRFSHLLRTGLNLEEALA